MSETIDAMVAALSAKDTSSFDAVAKFIIKDEGAILLDATGVRAGDAGAEADVTLTASMDTFRAIFEGDMNPTMAFMTGKLSVDGNMGLAMKLGAVLS